MRPSDRAMPGGGVGGRRGLCALFVGAEGGRLRLAPGGRIAFFVAWLLCLVAMVGLGYVPAVGALLMFAQIKAMTAGPPEVILDDGWHVPISLVLVYLCVVWGPVLWLACAVLYPEWAKRRASWRIVCISGGGTVLLSLVLAAHWTA